jgi:hypothetical protein
MKTMFIIAIICVFALSPLTGAARATDGSDQETSTACDALTTVCVTAFAVVAVNCDLISGGRVCVATGIGGEDGRSPIGLTGAGSFHSGMCGSEVDLSCIPSIFAQGGCGWPGLGQNGCGDQKAESIGSWSCSLCFSETGFGYVTTTATAYSSIQSDLGGPCVSPTCVQIQTASTSVTAHDAEQV